MSTTAITPARPKQSSIALRNACERLGIQPQQLTQVAQITPYIKEKFHLDTPVAIDYLRMSGTAEARKVVEMIDTPELRVADRKALPLEAYCIAAGVHPMNIIEILGGVLIRLGAQESAVMTAVHQPMIVAKTIESALTDGGYKDRVLIAKATGFLPTPKGSTTTIQVNSGQGQNAAPAQVIVGAPPPEQTIKRLTDRFNEGRQAQLPAPTVNVEPAEYIDSEEAEADDVDDAEE